MRKHHVKDGFSINTDRSCIQTINFSDARIHRYTCAMTLYVPDLCNEKTPHHYEVMSNLGYLGSLGLGMLLEKQWAPSFRKVSQTAEYSRLR